MEMERKKKRSSSVSDALALVKAAAWAWYEHGSGSEGKPVLEFDVTRRERASKPSRYKLEAMRNNAPKYTMDMEGSPSPSPSPAHPHNSLLDSYEIESISKRLDHLIEFSGIKFYDELLGIEADYQNNLSSEKNGGSGSGSGRKKKSNKLKGFFLLRHAVVCGGSQDVDYRAFRDERRRRPEKQQVHAHVIKDGQL